LRSQKRDVQDTNRGAWNVDVPSWRIELLDAQASRLGVTRELVITLWIAERWKEDMKTTG
jgi:hypothetical protein